MNGARRRTGGNKNPEVRRKLKLHELGDAPERKPASVDAKLAETSILSGSPTGRIKLPAAGCSSAASDKMWMQSTV